VVPWQPWFFGRKGDPSKGFKWTHHIFWGLEDVIENFTNGWNSVKTNKKVGDELCRQIGRMARMI
jgi:branched-chain amino acid transport system substrate-binding protein